MQCNLLPGLRLCKSLLRGPLREMIAQEFNTEKMIASNMERSMNITIVKGRRHSVPERVSVKLCVEDSYDRASSVMSFKNSWMCPVAMTAVANTWGWAERRTGFERPRFYLCKSREQSLKILRKVRPRDSYVRVRNIGEIYPQMETSDIYYLNKLNASKFTSQSHGLKHFR